MENKDKNIAHIVMGVLQMTAFGGFFYQYCQWTEHYSERIDLMMIQSCLLYMHFIALLIYLPPRMYGLMRETTAKLLAALWFVLKVSLGLQMIFALILWIVHTKAETQLRRQYLPGFILFCVVALLFIIVGSVVCWFIFDDNDIFLLSKRRANTKTIFLLTNWIRLHTEDMHSKQTAQALTELLRHLQLGNWPQICLDAITRLYFGQFLSQNVTTRTDTYS